MQPSAAADNSDVSVRGWSSARAVVWLTGGQGRPAAIALAALLAIFQVSVGERALGPLRNLLFDAYQRLSPRKVERFPVVIVDIDDASLAALGQWPWPRTRLAKLIEATFRLGALAVGLDIIMPEADRLSPDLVLADRQELTAALRKELAQLASNDAVLAGALRQTRTVVARAGIIGSVLKAAPKNVQTPVVIVGESPLAYLQSYRGHLTNISEIDAAASGWGYLNDTRDADGVVRAMPLVIAVNGELAPILGLELLRVATGEPRYSIHTNGNGVQGVQIGTSFIATDPDGRIRLHFSPAFAGRRVSALAILGGQMPTGALAKQVALIGLTGVGITDVVATPLATRMDGLEVQAQLIENILDGGRLRRPAVIPWLELLAFLVMAVALVLLLPRLRPGYGVVIFLAGAVLIGTVSLICFLQAKILYDLIFPTAGNALILTMLLTAGFSAADRQRRELDAALEVERIERLRMAGELKAAREIQMGMLPAPGAIKGLPSHVEFYAKLEPALEVGGDLYDAFMLDEDHLFFLVGDVSGKGVPASLFMALSKTLCKSLARRQHAPLDALVRRVNQEISGENPAMLFLTAIVGVLDARTGELEICNAGHDAPILLRANEPPHAITGAGGPPLCVNENFPYAFDRLLLQPGDMLVLITDGVTEAQDSTEKFYGLPRVLDHLANVDLQQCSAATVCEGLYEDVKRFTDGSAPSDDITIMAIRFGAQSRPTRAG
jgi:serine phosphatase RsbU (regulator of sigma subunit)